MILSVLGAIAIFGISEIAGEVYHQNHVYDNKNFIINNGKRFADISEKVENKIAEKKKEKKAKKENDTVIEAEVKDIDNKDGESINAILSTLDKQIQSINKSKTADIISAEVNVTNSFAKVCGMIIKEGLLSKKDLEQLSKLQNQATELAADLADGKYTNQQTAKKEIKELGNKIVPYIEKNTAKKEKSANENTKSANFTVVKDEVTSMPDFTKPVSPLKFADDIDTENN